MVHRIALTLLLFRNIFPVYSQNDTLLLSLKCQSQTESCSTCVNTHDHCFWCYDLDFIPERCDLRHNLVDAKCRNISNVRKSIVKITENKNFQDVLNSTLSAVQIKPQRIKLQLRPGDENLIKLKYRVAKNYPLDLYYLIDSTFTMKDDIETLVTLGDELSQQIANLTKHFRMGFGSFSDKVLLPFYKMDALHLANPCKDQGQVCAPGFNFKHAFDFNSNVDDFIAAVNNIKVTANLDNAEGCLDALMQIVVCNKTIGWHEESRKLVLVLTNGLLHFAGDGKVAGVVKKCDGLCHLDKDGIYSESNFQDYPSIDQIYKALKEQKINVIFAITEDVLSHYKKLNDIIADYTYVTELHSDSSNILNVIKQGYEDAVSTVSFHDNSSYPVEIKYYSNCNTQVNNQTNFCPQIKEGHIYEFDVLVTLKHCPSDKKLWHQTITIDEKSLHTEKLRIDFEMLCGCDCEKHENDTGALCNYHGYISCGICKCDPGWSGDNCNCDLSNFENSRILENNCRKITENTTSAMCHSRGDCECGKCLCEPSYTGKFCECPRCEEVNGKQCGGPMRGMCNCGTCLCKEDYAGPDCTCSLSAEGCKAPGDTSVCSDRGQCECGKCKCDTDVVFYSGKYCERCATCEGLCHLYKDCVECTILNNCQGHECIFRGGIYNTEYIDSLEDLGRICTLTIYSLECRYWRYTYNFNKNHAIDLKILRNNCNSAVTQAETAIYSFLAIVLIGVVALFAYKMKMIYDYKREYAKHMKNVLEVQYKEINPLYVTPFRQYEVPRTKTE